MLSLARRVLFYSNPLSSIRIPSCSKIRIRSFPDKKDIARNPLPYLSRRRPCRFTIKTFAISSHFLPETFRKTICILNGSHPKQLLETFHLREKASPFPPPPLAKSRNTRKDSLECGFTPFGERPYLQNERFLSCRHLRVAKKIRRKLPPLHEKEPCNGGNATYASGDSKTSRCAHI